MKNKKLAVGRNAPCPCGSGRKYKKCCLGKTEPKTEDNITLYARKYKIRLKQPEDIKAIRIELGHDRHVMVHGADRRSPSQIQIQSIAVDLEGPVSQRAVRFSERSESTLACKPVVGPVPPENLPHVARLA